MKHTLFKKAIEDIKGLSMTVREKQAILARIVEKQLIFIENKKQSEVNSTYHKLVKSPWSIYSFGTWVRIHKLASIVAAILIIAISGNSIVLAANESLPGDRLYSIKVNVTEPIRIALTSDLVKKVEIQTSLVRTRFEEAETLAARGQLDDAKEKKISGLIARHVENVSKNVTEVEKTSLENAEDANITIQASMKAHARLLNKISRDKLESPTRLSNAKRIAEKADKESRRFDTRLIMMTASEFSSTTIIQASSEKIEDISKSKVFKIKMKASTSSTQVSREVSFVATSTDNSSASVETSDDLQVDNDKNYSNTRRHRGSSAASSMIEIKKRDKEEEIYKKAKERLEKEHKKEELRRGIDIKKENSDNNDQNKRGGSDNRDVGDR